MRVSAVKDLYTILCCRGGRMGCPCSSPFCLSQQQTWGGLFWFRSMDACALYAPAGQRKTASPSFLRSFRPSSLFTRAALKILTSERKLRKSSLASELWQMIFGAQHHNRSGGHHENAFCCFFSGDGAVWSNECTDEI